MADGLAGRIFVTGGAGFLGRGLIRAAERNGWDCQFTIYSRDEEKQHKLRRRWPNVRCILGDVRDRDRLEQSMAEADIVIHAAAIKFIPEAEANVAEAISVNVGGSQNVVNAAFKDWPKVIVGISTDKAALPVNTYGATKMLMERLFTRASAGQVLPPTFVSVRYGNVVGSTGSIIPLFQDQLRRNGKVTVTDPTMSRFWISIDEAVDLILLAVGQAHARPGGIFVPRCKSMNIGKLAEMIVGEQGLDPSESIEIMGLRPGEKKHEELVHYQESVLAEKWNDDYFVLHPQAGEHEWVNRDQEPWTYSSLYAERLSAEEMQAMIEDAKDLAF